MLNDEYNKALQFTIEHAPFKIVPLTSLQTERLEGIQHSIVG
jgi:hypothetical protein